MSRLIPGIFACTLIVTLAATPDAEARRKRKAHAARHHKLVGRRVSGVASWSQRTPRLVTAARGVPRGSKLWVWRQSSRSSTGTSVIVNDSGPYVGGRVLDLSTGAFRRVFGGLGRGHGPVHYKVVRVGRNS